MTNKELRQTRLTQKGSKLKFAGLCRLEDHDCFAFSETQKQTIRKFIHFIHATLMAVTENDQLKENLKTDIAISG